jgi:hypothetical protein
MLSEFRFPRHYELEATYPRIPPSGAAPLVGSHLQVRELIALAPVAYPKNKKRPHKPDRMRASLFEEPMRGFQEDEPDS